MSAAGAQPGLRLVTINACGLSGHKLVKLVSWLRESHFDGVVVTETQIAENPEDLFRRQPGSGAIWPGAQFFHVPGTGHTGGILVILGPSSSFSNITQLFVLFTLSGGGAIHPHRNFTAFGTNSIGPGSLF